MPRFFLFSFPKEKKCRFLTDEKTTKRVAETVSRTLIHLLGSTYTRLERCCSARGARTDHHSPCGKHLRLGSPRPQAQGARRVSAFRHGATERGGGPRITRAPRAWTPSFIAATEPLPAAQTVKPEACSSFDAFLSVKKSMRSLLSKEEEMSFSHRRENDEKSRRDGVSDSHPSAGKHIHTARKVLQCSRGSHRPPLPVREVCAAGSPRPQAQSCRPHKRSSRRLAASFRSFLVRRGKEHKMLIFFKKHIYKGIICKIILQIIPVNDILTL